LRITPFAPLRPTRETAARVAAVPYDTVSLEEARRLVEGNDWNFLHVTRAEVDLPAGSDPHAPAAYAKAAGNLRGLLQAGALVRDDRSDVFVYRLAVSSWEQTGVFACFHADDYTGGVVRRHEKTRPDKEDDRLRLAQSLGAHAGPVLLAFRPRPEVDAVIAAATARDPLFDFVAPDGVKHTVWRAADTAACLRAFASVDAAYVCDGHHRAAAAARLSSEARAADPAWTPDAPCNWFPAVAFPADRLRVLPYNRCVRDLNGFSPSALLAEAGRRFRVTPDAGPEPESAGHASMYLAGRWHDLAWEPDPGADPVANLDVSVLQDRFLAPVLGIVDPRTSQRIFFVSGARGTAELARAVDAGEAAVAFAMHPVAVGQILSVSDAGAIMPPKSTWFEPKPRSGLLVYAFGPPAAKEA
jgi:uncharacterized protein (DUF1015 family)